MFNLVQSTVSCVFSNPWKRVWRSVWRADASRTRMIEVRRSMVGLVDESGTVAGGKQGGRGSRVRAAPLTTYALGFPKFITKGDLF